VQSDCTRSNPGSRQQSNVRVEKAISWESVGLRLLPIYNTLETKGFFKNSQYEKYKTLFINDL